MSQKEIYILDKDKQWLNTRINELEKQIQDLGPEFYDVFNQSSETWHDNAPFDALRDRQSVMFAEYSQLRITRQNAALQLPKKRKGVVNIGSSVIINSKSYQIAGHWTPFAGQVVNEHVVVSMQSPLGETLLGKKVHDSTRFGVIEEIIN